MAFCDAIAIIRLSPLCSSRQTASCLAIKTLRYLKYCGLCPHPQPLKKVDQIFMSEYKVSDNSKKTSDK